MKKNIFRFSFIVVGLCALTVPAWAEELPNPIGDVKDPNELIARIIEVFLGFVGAIALLMFIYGGFLWLISAGNEERVKKGRATLMWAALGLLIIFASYGITQAVFEAIAGRATPSTAAEVIIEDTEGTL